MTGGGGGGGGAGLFLFLGDLRGGILQLKVYKDKKDGKNQFVSNVRVTHGLTNHSPTVERVFETLIRNI